jgi:hypothetical protein
MKRQMISAFALFSFLTAGGPLWAQGESRLDRASGAEALPMTTMGLRVNSLIGASTTEGKSSLSGGTTVELGELPTRKFETGLIALQTGASARPAGAATDQNFSATFLAVPLLAKFRLLDMHAQSWFLKAGAMPAAKVSQDDQMKDFNVLASVGLSGKLVFTRRADFVVEASYNRGLMDSLRAPGTSYSEGVTVLAGLSFRL